MKKRGIIFSIIAIIFVVAIFVLTNLETLKEGIMEAKKDEYIQYAREQILKDIDVQLQGVDMDLVRSKADMIVENDIAGLQNLIQNGELSYEELTAFYLDRIRNIDQSEKGLNAIAAINPNAMEQAREFDKNKEKSKQNILYGMPITLKDNILKTGMPTTVGTFALKDFYSKEDADIVKKLQESEVLILAKANLSELANFVSAKMPSGYSSAIGQTMNPFKPQYLSPFGSSSGSAVSITSNIGVASIGTETTGSIISPSYINSVVGLKPSHNLVSGEGIFPLAPSIDTAGPIARTVSDVAYIYNAMVLDENSKINTLEKDYLRGRRIGFPSGSVDPNAEKLKKLLEELGAEIVDVDIDYGGLDNRKLINSEFKESVKEFAQKYELPFKTLEELINFNKEDAQRRIKFGQDFLEEANEAETDRDFVQSQIKLAQERLDKLQKEHNLDAIASLNEEGILLSAMAGYPEITVPFGVNDENAPMGAMFIGFKDGDKKIIQLAYSLEQQTKLRQVPKF